MSWSERGRDKNGTKAQAQTAAGARTHAARVCEIGLGELLRGVSDEAITDVLCDIVATTPNLPKHLGKEVTCSLMCSREYGRVDDPDEKRWPRIGKGQTVPERPFLLNMRLGKDGGVFSTYLPEAAYWALQADLKSGRLKFIEASFIKRRHGDRDLTSINFSETPPKP